MGPDGRAVVHDVGLLLFLPGTMAAASVPVAIGLGEPRSAVPLTVAAVVCGAVGAAVVHRYRDARALHRWPAVEVVALGWLTCVVVGAAVLWGVGVVAPEGSADAGFAAPVDAVFEATSGITSTGLSVADGRESELSPIVQWWRTLMQWVGGVGVVLFAVGFGHTAARVTTLYEAEGRSDDFGGDVRHTVRAIMAIYSVFTLLAIGAFLATEKSTWAAIHHGMTGIATGGFTVTDDSFAGYGPGTQLVAITVMLVGALSFVAHHLLLVERDPRAWSRLTPTRAQLSVWAVGLIAVLALARWSRPELPGIDLAFQWASASATAGFASHEDLSAWGVVLLPVLVVAMVVGAASGSTGGGVKLDRIVWVGKDLVSRVRGTPRQPAPLAWDGDTVDDDDRRVAVRHAAEMLGLWVLTLVVGTAVLVWLTDAAVIDVLFDTTSALSNVGLDAGVAGGDLPSSAKLVLTALMYLGRLELLAALVLASQREHIDERDR